MRVWKTVRTVCIILLVLFAAGLVYEAVRCMGYHYPMPMMGVEADNWTDAFVFNVGLFLMMGGIVPLIAVTGLLIYSCFRIKKLRGE